MKRVGWEKKYPEWQVRKARLLENVMSSPEFKSDLDDFKVKYKGSSQRRTFPAYLIMEKYHLPYGCLRAVEKCLLSGEILKEKNVEEWIQYVQAEPITYLDLEHDIFGPSGNPLNTYFSLLKLLRNDEEAYRDFMSDKTLLLIPRGATRKEIDAFLDKNFRKMQNIITGHKNRPLSRARRLSDQDRQIVELRESGASFADIANSFPTAKDESYIAKRYKAAKKRIIPDK